MSTRFNYGLNVGFALAFYFYLLYSFLIGFISISVGYYYPVYFSEIQLGLLAFLPLFLYLLFSIISQKIPFLYFIAPLCWYGAIISPIILVKYLFVIAGIVFTLTTLIELLQIINKKTIDPRTFVIALIFLDQVVKGVNQGQYPISNVSVIALGLVSFLTLFVMIFLRDFMKILKTLHVEEHVSTTNSWSILPLFFSVFLFMFVFGNNGIISYGNGLDLNISIMITIMTSLLLPLGYFMSRDFLFKAPNQMYIGLGATFILIISLMSYPWFDLNVIFWLLGILSIAMILHTSVDSLTFKTKKSLVAFVTISYFIIALILFVMILTELYVLFEVLALLVFSGLLTRHFFTGTQEDLVFIGPGKLFFGPLCEFFKSRKVLLRYGLVILITVVISTSTFLPTFVTINQPNLPNSGIRTMAYNLHFSQNNSGFDNIGEVAKLVSNISPNFVSFEEVMFNGPINGFSNMFGRLKNLLDPIGYKYSYHTTGTPTFLTNAFFSMYPIVNASTINLLPKDQFYRTALNVVLDLGSGKYLRVVPVHLTSVIENASNPDRVKQGQYLLDTLQALHSNIPTIIMGDFNSFPDWPETFIFSSKFQDAWNVTNPDSNGFTWPTYGSGPNQRIDYIFVDNSIPVTSCSITNNLPISDHNAIYCNLNF